MKFIISISRPGKSWSLSEGHGKPRKSKMLSEKRQNDKQLKNSTDESETDLNFGRERHKHAFYAL